MKTETIKITRLTLKDGYFCDIIPVGNILDCYLCKGLERVSMFGLEDSLENAIKLVEGNYKDYLDEFNN